ncbi:MAG TPA: peptide deformylase [Puia sp.]|nr:peptide deformylase [Puia sp.]
MILPIIAYGAQVLRTPGKPVSPDYPGLAKLVEDMWETMYESNGVGLAAPQVNLSLRLFVIDSTQIFRNLEEDEQDKYPDGPGFRGVFINPKILKLNGATWAYSEGCLSIPKIHEEIFRNEEVTIEYNDENFQHHTRTFNGITARVILHEYDHIEGKLFIDYLKPLKRKLLRSKLDDISKGKVQVDYKMEFLKA